MLCLDELWLGAVCYLCWVLLRGRDLSTLWNACLSIQLQNYTIKQLDYELEISVE